MKVLCLSFHAPPTLRPQALLLGKMMPEWLRQGIDVSVVSLSRGDWDLDIEKYELEEYKPFPFDLCRYTDLRQIWRKMRTRNYYSQLKKIIKSVSPDIIFSFANPQESNLLGAYIKRKTGLPFVSHFSDPYYDNPYKGFSDKDSVNILALENEIITESDRVVFVTDGMRELIMKKYPEEFLDKSRVVAHCYDKQLYPDSCGGNKGKIVISHIGAFYRQRNPEIFFSAFSMAVQKDPALLDKFIIRVIGGDSEYTDFPKNEILALADQYGLSDILDLKAPVSYQQSLAEMADSDILLNIDADYADSPFLTSKIVDYVGSGKPFMVISPEGSPTAQLAEKLGQLSFSYRQTEEISEALLALADNCKMPYKNIEYAESFAVAEQTKRYKEIFLELI